MNQNSSRHTTPKRALMHRLHNISLHNRFPLSGELIRWEKINQLFLLLALTVAFFGIWNVGQQIQIIYASNPAINESNDSSNLAFHIYDWIVNLGIYDLGGVTPFAIGLLYFIPLVLVSLLACEFWDWFFVKFFNRIKDGGNLSICFIFALLLPINIPLSYVILGISFGIVFGKFIFGGTGRYLVSPVLLGVLFLSYSYPSLFNDSFTNILSTDAYLSMPMQEHIWSRLLTGGQSGFVSIATVSGFWSLLCLTALLVLRKEYVGVVIGALLGLWFATLLLNSPDKSAVWQIQWYWHLVTGSFAFCLVFIATDLTVLPITPLGRIIYGCIFGFLTLVIRIANKNHPEGTMMALLLTSLLVPIVDWFIVMSHQTILQYKRRRAL